MASSRRCIGVSCENEAGTLQCPTCLKQGKESYFCSQDCFKKSWPEHKALHKATVRRHNPFPKFKFTGSVKPVYPLSAPREVPASIRRPDYALDGNPKSERKFLGRLTITVLDQEGQEAMRRVCALAREVLDIAGREVRPGITTDHIDEIVHKACIERDVGDLHVLVQTITVPRPSLKEVLTRTGGLAQSYPSPLNYVHFPKSVCTSPNEVICHGIPDQRVLLDGDILNIDVTLYHQGYHGDLNETYYVGDRARADPETVRVVETARECLEAAVALVKPGMLFRDPGTIIEKHARARCCTVVKTYCGHGINQLFHCAPSIPHYAKNKAVGTAKPGMCFTIEPMISLGTHRDKTWPDDWTSVTADGRLSAQFEHTLLVTETGVEVLTARKADSPGGPIPMPKTLPGVIDS
ncbi:MAG: Methionine aminopeptidase 1 [Lichina confinis]|nr:MAG: Methionine aminopeptidase 1 [Lichina confinis]